MNDVFQMFDDWFQKPFDPNGDVWDWILFIGFVSIVLFMWSRVVNKIQEQTA